MELIRYEKMENLLFDQHTIARSKYFHSADQLTVNSILQIIILCGVWSYLQFFWFIFDHFDQEVGAEISFRTSLAPAPRTRWRVAAW